MGLLEDAIREHLDLKRQRGADPQEIEVQESEALGAVNRVEPIEAAYDEPAGVDAGQEELPLEEGAEPPYDEAEAPYDEAAAPPADLADEPPYEEPAEPAAEGAVETPYEETVEPPAGEAAEPPAESPPPVAEDDARAREAAADPAATQPHEPVPAEPGSEDVLEETPEFLQETPEHDRLWFEQRPPRDFDFDG